MRFLLMIFFLISCQGGNPAHDAALKRKNQKGEYIYRNHNVFTDIPPMELVKNPSFKSKHSIQGIPLITKEYFRCKGSAINPTKVERVGGEMVRHVDCGGVQKHSLPLKDGKEWVYPILLELVNHLQVKTGKKVVITSGHRCPDHNTYVDSMPYNQTSKHQIGAEVDFYVQGIEERPESVIQMIIDYYKNDPEKGFREFTRYEKGDTHILTKPWMNKEIFIKLYKKHEGRNFDNRHPYSYISIQVRYDRDKKERVNYSWDLAFRNFLRY